MKNVTGNELPIDNLEDLKERVKMSGFGDYFNAQLEENIRAGKKEFSLAKPVQIENDQMGYKLDIRIDNEKRRGYVNDLHATLREADGMERSQRFPHFLRITAKEAYNLLKWGNDISIEKNLFNKQGQPYRSFVTLNIKGNKDEHDNYPLMQYHERYYSKQPFVLEDALQKLAIPIKELQTNPDFVLASLKRGNMTAVTIFHNGQEEKGFLSVNAKAGSIDIRDQYKAVIEIKNQSRSISETKTLPQDNSEDVKKDFPQQQEVGWKQAAGKGLTR